MVISSKGENFYDVQYQKVHAGCYFGNGFGNGLQLIGL